MADIRNVFNGPFAHKHGHNYQWTEYTGKIPYPRPGTVRPSHLSPNRCHKRNLRPKLRPLSLPIQCPGGTFTPGIPSSKSFSDEAVNFIRSHPLMYHPVYPTHRRPLVVRTGVDYRFTALVVDQVDAVDGRYEVLFLGTGEAPPGVGMSKKMCGIVTFDLSLLRSGDGPESYRSAQRSDDHGGTDARGSGGLPGMFVYKNAALTDIFVLTS